MLQQLTQETASNAAMASNLAASAGWGLVATLLHKTSKELVRRVGAWTNPGTAFDALYGVQSARTTHESPLSKSHGIPCFADCAQHK
jgi:hypothetical protein